MEIQAPFHQFIHLFIYNNFICIQLEEEEKKMYKRNRKELNLLIKDEPQKKKYTYILYEYLVNKPLLTADISEDNAQG